MANCNELFSLYNGTIKLSDEKRTILKEVRNNLRAKMLKKYPELSAKELLEFHSQGSFVMDTIITPKDDDYDLDDGVYFIGSSPKDQRAPIQKFHDAVLFAVDEDENYAEVTDKDTCVRVRYVKEKFHIDLPIYYADSIDNPNLAHLKEGWILSNPIEFIDWFEKKAQSGFQRKFFTESQMYNEYQNWLSDIRKKDVQLRRIVRYLKGWADELRGEMPPGIVMTILAAENYVIDDRDDLSLCYTLEAINRFLAGNGFKCPRPTTPLNEDLFAEYSQTKKDYFKDRLTTFIESAKQAIASDTQKEACLKWQKHLGSRFSCAFASNSIEGAQSFKTAPIIGSTAKSA
jgi:hypothetical protein